MSTRVEQLLKAGAANMANSLGQVAGKPGTHLSPVITPAGPDKYAGRTRGNLGKMAVVNIVPDPGQPRTEFDEDEMNRLAEDLRARGQLQPIRVRWSSAVGKWVIIAGERRYRAAVRAGLSELSCEFVEDEGIPAAQILEDQLVENALRSDLKPIEQARAYRRLMEMTGRTGKEVAERLHIHPTTVTRAIQLLDLPAEVQARIDEGVIAPSVGVELAKVGSPEEQLDLAQKIASEKLTRSEAAAVVSAKRPAGKGKGTAARKQTRQPKTFTFKTEGRCIVTLTFRKPASTDEIRRALIEVLDEIDRDEKAA